MVPSSDRVYANPTGRRFQFREVQDTEIKGRWSGLRAQSVLHDGKLSSTWEIKDNKIIDSSLSGNGVWKYHIDVSIKPCHIDLIPDGGPASGKILKGVFKIDGDTLTVCSVRPGI